MLPKLFLFLICTDEVDENSIVKSLFSCKFLSLICSFLALSIMGIHFALVTNLILGSKYFQYLGTICLRYLATPYNHAILITSVLHLLKLPRQIIPKKRSAFYNIIKRGINIEDGWLLEGRWRGG